MKKLIFGSLIAAVLGIVPASAGALPSAPASVPSVETNMLTPVARKPIYIPRHGIGGRPSGGWNGGRPGRPPGGWNGGKPPNWHNGHNNHNHHHHHNNNNWRWRPGFYPGWGWGGYCGGWGWNSPYCYGGSGIYFGWGGGWGGGYYGGGYYPYGYAPRYAGTSSRKHVNWCRNRYKTYNARTDTFVGKGMKRYRCNSPYDGR